MGSGACVFVGSIDTLSSLHLARDCSCGHRSGSIPLLLRRQSGNRASERGVQGGETMSQAFALASIGLLAVAALDSIALAFLLGG
jgi:hypothetical protein